MATPEHVCLPINLDAFILNEAVCEQGLSRISPITQPNYASLRLDNSQIQHDILPHVDLHNSQPAIANPRISQTFTAAFQNLNPLNPSPDPATLSGINRSRLGVYLHWTIPRAYRSGASQAAPADPTAKATNPNPTFPLVPNRWLLVRILRDWTPKTAKPDTAAAWIIESDKLRKIEELDGTIDIETDVTPFVAYSGDASSNSDILNNQAEKYIGDKIPLSRWKGESARKGDPDRVALTVMNSSNPLFADYAIHNPNVFSTKDNFQYGTDSGGNAMYLDTALCDYVVVGWHSSMADDPLGVVANPNAPAILRQRLTRLFCAAPTNADGLDDAHTTDASTVNSNNSGAATRLICHAARYSVRFDTSKPKTPADDYAVNFTQNRDMEPVSVGTTPLDAVLAFFQAHQKDDSFESGLFGDGTAVQTAQTLMEIQELLYATEDDYDSRIRAADLIYAHNFSRTAGGITWHYDQKKDPNGPPVAPSSNPDPVTKMSQVGYLNQLNECQRAWDAANRKLDQLRWALFSEFFKFVSDPSNESGDRAKIFTSRIPKLRAEAVALQGQKTTLQATMDSITGGQDPTKAKLPVKKVAGDPFFTRTDPTLCLAGIDAGWDAEFLSGSTPTRFVHQLSPAGSQDSSLVKDTLSLVPSKLAGDITTVVGKLLAEGSGGFRSGLAQYGHKQWVAQPFCPQFVEWEGVYYHIQDDQWRVSLTNSALTDSKHQLVTYVNPNQLSTLDASISPKNDVRHISGRMLVLPQPSFALDAVVGQVLGTALPGDLPKDLQTHDQQTAFRNEVKSLKFISGQLTGLSDALMTLAVGQHVKPNVRPQGGDPLPMKPAVDIGSKYLGMNEADFILMGSETAKTPYGTLTDFSNVNNHPFKPLQQGQFAITKLTIVDKFGQAISVPASQGRTPRVPNPKDIPEFIHPCLSAQLIPSLLDGALNTVYTTKETQDAATQSGYPMTPFVQLTPAINQDARINSAFLEQVIKPDKSYTWKVCSDWENPIFGWVIVNYADSSLQFFTGEGIFYTALAYGGPTGIIESNTFLPFEPPANAESLVSPQLDAFIQEMTAGGAAGRNYFHALWDLIRRAIPSMPFPPSDYAQYANAIVGKPLALVNVGWSLELAQPPFWPQHTLPSPGIVPDNATIDPLRQAASDYLTTYPFHVKIGDSDRPFDGVVAYWNATDARPFDKIFTYFPDPDPKKDDGIRIGIAPDNFPSISPYFIDPHAYPDGSGFIEAQTAQMMVKTVLMDPYTPVHLYSGILPISNLPLPAWTLQNAMKNMTAFFTMGPLLVTQDVPKIYDAANPLHADTWLKTQNNASTTNAAPLINLPIATGKGLWNWLQPYALTAPPKDGAPTLETRYNSLEVGAEDGRMRMDPAPYTFVEGFFQLARPLVQIPVPPDLAATTAPATDILVQR